jgi:hypothetical protein
MPARALLASAGDAEAGSAASRPEHPREIPAGFDMDNRIVGAGFGVSAGVPVRIGDHQVRFERWRVGSKLRLGANSMSRFWKRST